MGYQDLRAQRSLQAFVRRRSRRFVLVMLLTLTYLLVGVGLLIYTRDLLSEESPPLFPEGSVMLSYGLSRDSITRSFTVDIPQSQPSTGAAPDLSVRLSGDLRRETTNGEFPAEFPEGQLTVGVNRLTDSRLSIAVTADPWAPERVKPGLFLGTIQVRGPGARRDVPIAVWLEKRDSRPAMLALTLILLGSMLGLLVKYITERLTPQATLARRLGTLKRALNYQDDGATLPVRVRMRIDDLEDQISRSDYASVEKSFEQFDKDKSRLATISWQFRILIDQLDQQAQLLDEATGLAWTDRRLIEGVLEAEFREVQAAQVLDWPTQEADMVARSREYASSFGAVTGIISRFLRGPNRRLRAHLFDIQQGYLPSSSAALEMPASDIDADDEVAEAGDGGGGASRSVRSGVVDVVAPGLRQDPGRVSLLFRQARTIAAIASVVVVSLVGLKTQYLDQQSFGGSLSDWLGLGLWGLVVELSGVAVLDVLGRLGSSGVGGSQTRP